MKRLEFEFCGARLAALGSGALHWPDEKLLVVSDLHLGKSERIARRSGQMLPPYETLETLSKLDAAIAATEPAHVLCLGDSFDDLDAGPNLPDAQLDWITRLMAGRQWTWIEGNHDPGPLEFGGTHLTDWRSGPLVFRHIAQAGGTGEVSGHYHPKIRLNLVGRHVSRPAFLFDKQRLIMPAFGAYTGGLRSSDRALSGLLGPDAKAILLGQTPHLVPMPR